MTLPAAAGGDVVAPGTVVVRPCRRTPHTYRHTLRTHVRTDRQTDSTPGHTAHRDTPHTEGAQRCLGPVPPLQIKEAHGKKTQTKQEVTQHPRTVSAQVCRTLPQASGQSPVAAAASAP